MNFRDFQYSFGKFKTNVEGQIVRNISYKNRNTRQLSVWIFRERDDLSSLRTLAYQHSETNKALLQWINEEAQNNSDSEEERAEGEKGEKGEEQDNYDLKDLVGDKIVELLNKQVEIEQGYADQLQSYRQVVKSIRIREEQVANIREHRKVLQYRLTQLESKKSKKNGDKITDLQSQIASVEEEKNKAEIELAEFKRVALREAFYIRFNALAEYAEKASIIAGFGKYLTDLLTFDSSGTDYNKYNQQVANTIFSDAMQALNQWVPTQSDERPTLSASLPKDMKESKDKNRNKKNRFKKGKNKKDKDELEHEEEPLTPPELPPRQYHVDSPDHQYHHHHHQHSVFENTGSSSRIPGLFYRNREFSSGSASSSDSKENTSSSEPYQEAPPPSYTACLSTTSLNEILNDDTTPISSQVRLNIQTEEEEHTDHRYGDSGPSSMSSPCSFFSYHPFEQINQQIQNKNKSTNKRSYMEFSQQYTHRRQPVLHLSQPFEPTLLPPPLPRSRSIASIPLSLTAPSAPTEDEIDYLPIPSAPPPSEFN